MQPNGLDDRTDLPVAWDAGHGQSTPEPQQSLRPTGVRVADADRKWLRRRAGRSYDSIKIAESGGWRELLRREAVYRRLLATADVLAAAASLTLTITVIAGHRLPVVLLAWLPVVVLISKAIGLYDRDDLLVRKSTLEETPALLQVATLCTFLVYLSERPLIGGRLTHVEATTLWVMLVVSLLLARAAARRIARATSSPERCLVVGDAAAYDTVAAKVARSQTIKAELVGRVSLGDERGSDQNGMTHADPPDLPRLIVERRVERVILAPSRAHTDDLLDLVWTVEASGARVSVLPRVLEVVGSSVEFDDVDGLTMLGIRRFRLTKSSQFLKRSFDVAGAVLGLVAIAPILFLIALLIRLDSRGRVLFRQVRVDRDSQRFSLVKFRTMYQGAETGRQQLASLNEADGLFKITHDPRITRVGRLLRRLSLDELPQLWNVLRGEMSLVGPRPLVVDEDLKIRGWHRRRLHLTPGMTGHWQILGSSRVPLQEMLAIDYLYVANWSLWSDVKILLRTVPYLLTRGGL